MGYYWDMVKNQPPGHSWNYSSDMGLCQPCINNLQHRAIQEVATRFLITSPTEVTEAIMSSTLMTRLALGWGLSGEELIYSFRSFRNEFGRFQGTRATLEARQEKLCGKNKFSEHSYGLQRLQESVKVQKFRSKVRFKCQGCPTVCYSKCDLYNLVDKQKKVKIDSYKALLNYQLCFTDIAAQLQISSQLSWIEKDGLFFKGLKWNNQRQYVDDPWPTYQVAQEAERLLKEGYRFKLREVHLARDQWSTQEAQFKAKMQELRAVWTKEQCQGLEKCSESARLGLKASQPLSSTSLEIQSLTRNLQDSSKPLKAPGVGLRSQAVEVDGIEVAVAEPSSLALVEGQCKSSFNQIQTPSIKPQDAEDKLGVNERPIKAAAHALEVPELVPEPRGDLCEVPE
ncbi:hypothetical protein EDD17DRAFT_1503922 [Pisolithus thermaeus]|nr:hypothetical protein EV401DRAFT_1891498 [Pisolithus croceorrhizus]KAI6167682.1 hypothetical protein EDD17DRAFT_1503922 [Pisolithus thermaeus]